MRVSLAEEAPPFVLLSLGVLSMMLLRSEGLGWLVLQILVGSLAFILMKTTRGSPVPQGGGSSRDAAGGDSMRRW